MLLSKLHSSSHVSSEYGHTVKLARDESLSLLTFIAEPGTEVEVHEALDKV